METHAELSRVDTRHTPVRWLCLLIVPLGCLVFSASQVVGQIPETVSVELRDHQYELSREGRAFLLNEATRASFFMLGELHGDNEIPALIREIWPPMWQAGYRHIAAEVSPWAAERLEFEAARGTEPITRSMSWARSEVAFVSSFKRGKASVLWGCDMEEGRPDLLIRELAAANPRNPSLQAAAELTKAPLSTQHRTRTSRALPEGDRDQRSLGRRCFPSNEHRPNP